MTATTFCNSDLVRLLGAWAPAPEEPAADFAERLALRLGPLDAIELQAATQQARTGRFAARRTPTTLARQLREDVDRVRQALARAIAQEVEPFYELQLPGKKGERAQPPSAADAIGTGYQRRHAALQKQMEQMAAAARDHLRQALSACSPRLQRLALLDATLEKVLAAREQAALPRIGRQLELRFRALRRQHEQSGDTGGADAWQRPGGWVHAFDAEWRQALLAERDLRLHAADGLVEAVAEEDTTQG
jgi:hypothetical protein